MKKINILLIFLISIFIFNSCTTVKDGFRSQKKNSTDEFLVKKKSPLVMPPEFDELPVPEDVNQILENNNEETDIKKLITNNENSSNENSTSQNTDFESLILEKIKNN